MNKFLILVIILLFSCSATNDFEGRITFIQPGILIENDNKESIWADLKDHDNLYKLGYPKRVSQIKIIDKDDNTKLFYVNPAQSLERINLLFACIFQISFGLYFKAPIFSNDLELVNL